MCAFCLAAFIFPSDVENPSELESHTIQQKDDPFKMTSSNEAKQNKERPEFVKSFQIFGLGIAFMFILNFAITKQIERNVDREKEFGLIVHSSTTSSSLSRRQ